MNAVYLVRKLPSALSLFLMPLRRWKAKDRLLGMKGRFHNGHQPKRTYLQPDPETACLPLRPFPVADTWCSLKSRLKNFRTWLSNWGHTCTRYAVTEGSSLSAVTFLNGQLMDHPNQVRTAFGPSPTDIITPQGSLALGTLFTIRIPMPASSMGTSIWDKYDQRETSSRIGICCLETGNDSCVYTIGNVIYLSSFKPLISRLETAWHGTDILWLFNVVRLMVVLIPFAPSSFIKCSVISVSLLPESKNACVAISESQHASFTFTGMIVMVSNSVRSLWTWHEVTGVTGVCVWYF